MLQIDHMELKKMFVITEFHCNNLFQGFFLYLPETAKSEAIEAERQSLKMNEKRERKHLLEMKDYNF